MRVVIAGFGAAGLNAVETIRKKNKEVEVTVFSRESELPYYRPRLPEIVSGSLSKENILAHPLSWYEERRIDILFGEEAVKIDPVNKRIVGSMGTDIDYDRLLIASGSESNKPDLPGMELPGVFSLRSLADAYALSEYACRCSHAVFIGGGLLGLEVAHALVKLGLKVTVLERNDRILPRQTTPDSAKALQEKLKGLGIEFLLESQAARFKGKDALEAVILKDGREIETTIAVISAGIVPNIDLAKNAGIIVDKAIVVDEYMRASQPDIFSAGDCAEFAGRPGGLWIVASKQGRVAGINMLADESAERQKYIPDPPSNILKIAGIDYMSGGNIDPDGKLPYVESRSVDIYRKVVRDEQGHIVGFVCLGTTRGNRELSSAMAVGKVFPAGIHEMMKNVDFDFSALK